MAKKINITETLAVEFAGRGPGEETPFWQGLIHERNGRGFKVVADFYNDGRGGSTAVRHVGTGPRGHAASDEIVRMARAAWDDLGLTDMQYADPEDLVIAWAELIGYGPLKCNRDEFTLQDYADLVWGDSQYESRTDEQRRRKQLADAKATRIEMVRTAERIAKRGQTLVCVGTEYFDCNTRDTDTIRRIVTKQHGATADFEILA